MSQEKIRLNIDKNCMCIKLIIRTQRNDKTLNVGECVIKLSAQDSRLQREISADKSHSSPEGGDDASAGSFLSRMFKNNTNITTEEEEHTEVEDDDLSRWQRWGFLCL